MDTKGEWSMNGYTISEQKCAVVDLTGELRDFIDMKLGSGDAELQFWPGNGWSDPYEYWYADVALCYVLTDNDLPSKELREHSQFAIWRQLVITLMEQDYMYAILRFTEPVEDIPAPWDVIS